MVITADQAAGPGNAGLYFIGDKKDLFLLAQLKGPAQILIIRDHYSGFSLDGLHHKTGDIRIFQCFG